MKFESLKNKTLSILIYFSVSLFSFQSQFLNNNNGELQFFCQKEFSNLKVIILKAGKLDYFLWKPKGVCLVFVKILRCGGSRRTAVLGNLIIYRQQKKCLRGRRIHTKGGNEKNLHISIEFALIIWLVTKGKLSLYIWSWLYSNCDSLLQEKSLESGKIHHPSSVSYISITSPIS